MSIFKKFKDDNSGVAIIMATIISTVLLVFCLALLMVSYTLYSSTSAENTEFATKELTKSIAIQFEKELFTSGSNIQKYLKDTIGQSSSAWRDFKNQENEAKDYRSFKLTDTEGRLGSYEAIFDMYYERGYSNKNEITLTVELGVKRGKSYYSIESQYFTSDLVNWTRR